MTGVESRARRVVLVADPEASFRRQLVRALGEASIEPVTCEGEASALSLLRGGRVEVAFVDLRILRAGGEALARALDAVDVVVGVPADEPLTPVELPSFVRALVERSAGAPERAAFAIERALQARAMQQAHTRSSLSPGPVDPEVVAATKATRSLVARAKRVAPSIAPVLVLGEPGTGKEMLARLIHRTSQRGALVTLDLSELSTAEADRELGVTVPLAAGEPSALDRASSATLLLLHVDRLTKTQQSALLARLASPRGMRVLATADPSIREAQRQGDFDPTLFIALSATLLEIPPLRQRRDEIPVLASHFLLEELARTDPRRELSIGPSAMRALRRGSFPLNVAELRSAVTHAALVARTRTIVPGDLPDEEGVRRTLREGLGEEPYAEARKHALREFERAYVEEVLARTDRNVAQAAREAGMDRANFRRLVKRARRDDGT